jgi:hypothetical protein
MSKDPNGIIQRYQKPQMLNHDLETGVANVCCFQDIAEGQILPPLKGAINVKYCIAEIIDSWPAKGAWPFNNPPTVYKCRVVPA